MNNNRGNNRRRGRGNRQQGGGGGQQLNRIDSRARGNAPQLLEKYRKLAHDAHLNGDRVQAEYYLQFADHYFRVIADARLRQEESRGRRDERWQEGGEPYRDENDDSGEFSVESDFPTFDQPPQFNRNRDERERGERSERSQGERNRGERPQRQPRPSDDERQPLDAENGEEVAEGAGNDEGGERSIYEPVENPFVRADRPSRGLRPRREDRRPRREESDEDAPAGLDPSSLPPSISSSRTDDESEGEAVAEEAVAKPRRGRPRRKPSADDAGEALESVN